MGFFKKIKTESEELGVPIWRMPDFILLIMAVVNVGAMLATYYWASDVAEDPREAVLLVAAESAIIVIFGNIMVESSKRIIELNKFKREIVRIISHQMRTPITTIKWNLEVFKKSQLANICPKGKKYLDAIYEENEKLREMVEEMLNIGRLEKLNEKQIHSEFSIEEIARQCLTVVSGYAKVKKIQIENHFDKNLKVIGTRDRVKIVIINLLENAVRYSKKNSRVIFKVKKKNDEVIITVKDFGIGIPEKDQAYIFNKFFRSDWARDYDPEGTGLGLYVVKKSTEQMGGEVKFWSLQGKGSKFTVVLPIKMKK